MLIIVMLIFGVMSNVSGNDIKQMLFTSPIIYKPVIDLVLSKNTKPLNRRQPTEMPKFEIKMIISNFFPKKEEKEKFDSFIQISFKGIDDIKFLIFKKNNFVQQLHVVSKKNNSETVVKYKREIDSLLSKISKENKLYYKKTKETFVSLLKQEDFLTDLPKGEHFLTFKLILLTDVAIGDVYFSNFSWYHGFQYYKYCLRNSALIANKKPLRIKFSVTYFTNYIRLANLFDEKQLNGFEAYFYPNQGLKWLTNLKNGKQEDVTIWSMNGKDKKKMSFNDWAKMIGAIKK